MEEVKRSNIVGIALIIFIAIAIILVLTGCSYSITMVHTEGAATDVVDETATNTPSTSLSVPISAAAM